MAGNKRAHFRIVKIISHWQVPLFKKLADNKKAYLLAVPYIVASIQDCPPSVYRSFTLRAAYPSRALSLSSPERASQRFKTESSLGHTARRYTGEPRWTVSPYLLPQHARSKHRTAVTALPTHFTCGIAFKVCDDPRPGESGFVLSPYRNLADTLAPTELAYTMWQEGRVPSP